MKKIISLIVIVSTLALSSICYADYWAGSGINDYPNNCYGDRAGASLIEEFDIANMTLYFDYFGRYNKWFEHQNTAAVKSDMTNISDTDLYIFAGHGTSDIYDSKAHFHNANLSGYSCSDDAVNAKLSTLSFGGNRLKWIFMYNCNWLRNYGSTEKLNLIWNSFKGATIMNGYCSTMYLHSYEGRDLAYYLSEGYSVYNAFKTASLEYQQYATWEVIGRTQGYDGAALDWTGMKCGPLDYSKWYQNYSGYYDIYGTWYIPA